MRNDVDVNGHRQNRVQCLVATSVGCTTFTVTKFLALLLRPLSMMRPVKLLAIEFVVVDRRVTRPLRQLSPPRTQGFDASNTPNI